MALLNIDAPARRLILYNLNLGPGKYSTYMYVCKYCIGIMYSAQYLKFKIRLVI